MSVIINGSSGITTPGLNNTGTTVITSLTTTGDTILGDASTDTLNVGNGNLILNSSGNLGLSVTPTARLDVLATYSSDTASQQRFRDNTGVSLNFGGTGGGKKFLQAQDSAGAATYYDIFINPLGGNLGVGTTATTNSRLTVVGDTGAGAAGGLVVRGKTIDYQGISLFYAENGANSSAARAWQLAPNFSANGNLEFRVSASSTTNPSSTAMTLDASGNLGVGTTSPSYPVDVQKTGGAQIRIKSTSTGGAVLTLDASSTSGQSNQISFLTNGVTKWALGGKDIGSASGDQFSLYNYAASSNAFTVDTSGNLLVGTQSSDGRLAVKASGSAGGTDVINAKNSSGTLMLEVRDDGLIVTSTAGAGPYALTTATAANMVVTAAGEFRRSTSSLKYKTTVQNANHGLADVLKLRPVTYKGKNDGETIFGGLIAEEVHEAGLTEFVQYSNDGTPDALAYGQMVSLAFKAIQELKAELDTAKEQIAALQGAA